MSRDLYITGYQPADELWIKMKEVWDICNSLEIEPPPEVVKFFNGMYPGDKPGQEINLKEAVQRWRNSCQVGFEINISKLPPNVKFIRAYIS